ncbi:MAG: class I SAM-dependent RNA methyltransferase [Motilibacteraceae bacterium]
MVGLRVEVDVGPVAHGGHCVARHEGRVLFVRHALPGERVVAEVTEGREKDSFLRADAVEVLTASPDRVVPPCPWAGPGRCGGCDWQHASLEAQRRLKADVVREQLHRLAHLEREVVVEPVPGDDHGLDWRTRVRFAVDEEGRAGLRKHRSHVVVPIDHCRIASPGVDRLRVTATTWPGARDVEAVASAGTGESLVLVEPAATQTGGVVHERAAGREWQVSGSGFWQVHPGAADALVAAVLEGLDPRPGESALDLYCGVGLFAGALAQRLGPGGRVTAVEGDRAAVEDARHNLADLPTVRIERGAVDQVLRALRLRRADLVVLDPPRQGAGRAVVEAVSKVRARAIAYVACDPAALARDLAWFAERGYELDPERGGLRAFDLFPMTAHVECVAVLRPVVQTD